MGVLDFNRSFVTFFTKPGQGSNIARIQIDATCTISWPDGRAETFYLIAPCRSEHMYLEGQLFQMPNYEFSGIFTEQEVLFLRTHWTSDREQPEYALVPDRFDRVEIRTRTMDADELVENPEIVDATLANRRLVVRTTINYARPGIVAQLEYPVKTMNVTKDPDQWQIDTGPLILPRVDPQGDRAIEWFDVAHIVSCDFEKAEFVLRKPHVVGELNGGPVSVTDYSQLVFAPAQHRFWAEADPE